MALSFISVNSDDVNLGDVANAEGANLSIEFWLKRDDNNHPKAIITKWQHGTSTSWTIDTQTDINPHELLFRDGNDATGGAYAKLNDLNTAIPIGEWHHFAIVYNGAGATNADKVKFYVDGVLKTLGFVGTIGATLPNATASVTFARFTGTITRYWDGDLDEVRIWNKSLTQQEIQSNMYRRISSNESNLVWYGRNDHGTGTAVVNLVNPGTNNGTITGADWVAESPPISYGE